MIFFISCFLGFPQIFSYRDPFRVARGFGFDLKRWSFRGAFPGFGVEEGAIDDHRVTAPVTNLGRMPTPNKANHQSMIVWQNLCRVTLSELQTALANQQMR